MAGDQDKSSGTKRGRPLGQKNKENHNAGGARPRLSAKHSVGTPNIVDAFRPRAPAVAATVAHEHVDGAVNMEAEQAVEQPPPTNAVGVPAGDGAEQSTPEPGSEPEPEPEVATYGPEEEERPESPDVLSDDEEAEIGECELNPEGVVQAYVTR